jgi:von Willebrand factor A domain-containing protein 3
MHVRLVYDLSLCVVIQVTVRKLVNAKYCNRFAHVIWNDGRVMHVNVTRELYRMYKERLNVAVSAMQRR